MSPSEIALGLAAASPQAMLPCPVCAAAVRGANLEHHLAKHPVAGEVPNAWPDTRRFSRARLTLGDGSLSVQSRFGLRRLSAQLAGPVAVGGLVVSRSGGVLSSYTDDHPGLAESTTARAGVYLQVGAARVGCRAGTDVRKHWDGLRPAPKRSGAAIVVAPAGFVALQYALARAGALSLRG